VVPYVSPELRTPCVSQTRNYQSVADAALIIVDLIEDRECANSKIAATDEILTGAESAAAAYFKQ
jgi:hypothetical protein